jgi:pimeloyl-[acyl-carrier protein] synthase
MASSRTSGLPLSERSPASLTREPLSLYRLLEPQVLADPYPLYERLRREDPVHWDPYLHSWVVTRYADVITVLRDFSAARTPTSDQLSAIGLSKLSPLARVMVKQMLFLDPPSHSRIRGLAACAFTPARVSALRNRIQQLANSLLDAVEASGRIDVLADFAEPLPAIVTSELFGVSTEFALQLKNWSAKFAEMLGNFQHNPGRIPQMLETIQNLTEFFRKAIEEQKKNPCPGLIQSLVKAEVEGDRLTHEEIVANCIITLVGGLETTTNLIGNGVLTLLRHPQEMRRLQNDPALITSAIEELLRYESPSQHTARLAPSDVMLGGKNIRKRQAVIAVMGAGNRDPERFPDPDRLDLTRQDNRHLAFGWAAHFCFGAPLARMEGQIAIGTLLERFPSVALQPEPIVWRENLGLRGLKALHVQLAAGRHKTAAS